MDFKNDTIPPWDFPKHEEVATTRIHPDYWKVIQWRFLIVLIFMVGVAVMFFLMPDLHDVAWYVSAGFLAIIMLLYFLHKAAFQRRSYAVREHDIIYRHGILSVNTTIVPFNRIQHIAVMEGFIARKYGVATLGIYTAGGSSADLRIAGLPADAAGAMKEIILRKIKRETHVAE